MTANDETREVPDGASLPAGPGSDEVRELLRRVVDPEVGVNIVDLGLVYRIEFAGDRLLIEMTMTSPACPMGDMIIDDAYKVLEGLSAACEPEIALVWEPPWNPSMMSQRSKLALGWSAE
ncbi:MAG TPA: metal-sulfur cluster assembly factor [Rhodocyclaceae bacterium]|nr:metal-sulfur cluster assembly factor [Rhodocyclaceae bacterium]